jgi:hypothetical protein
MADNATIPNNRVLPGRQGASGVAAITTVGNAARIPMTSLTRMKDILSSDPKDRVIVTDVRTGALELLPQMASALNVQDTALDYMQRAQFESGRRGMSFSGLLEEMDPSEQYAGTELANMDAFQRQLFFAGIRTQSIPEKGIYADQVNRFFQSNVPGSQVLFPEYINRMMRQALIAPDVLPWIIAVNTGVVGDFYRSIYTNDTVAQRRMPRVGQGAELPKTSFTSSERAINLYKYGRILEGSYEYFRTVTIDLFSILLQRIALQANLDKADTAIDVAINGDGNSNAATNYNQSTLDTGVTPTYKAFIAFALKFYPYQLNTLVGSDAAFINFLTMARPSVDPFQILNLLQAGEIVTQRVELAQNLYSDVKLVYLPSVPANVLVGLDRRFALEQLNEIGASLVETDRLIQSQRNQIAISEKVGYAQIFSQAILTWTTNA